MLIFKKIPGTITLLVFMCLACACSPQKVLDEIIQVDIQLPEFLGCKAITENKIEFYFSEPVQVASIHLTPEMSFDLSTSEGTVLVSTTNLLPAGEQCIADLLVIDNANNTLAVLTSFRARNSRIPKLQINEVRTEYSKPKVEFIELYTLSSGNMGALRVISSSYPLTKPLYEFPPIEVSKGEYIVLHLRTLEDGTMNEKGTDLTISGGTEANSTARDFWLKGTEKRIRKTDGIALIDQDEKILDALLLSENPGESWTKEEMKNFISFLEQKKAWKTSDVKYTPLTPSSAVITNGTTVTRTICRNETIPDSDSTHDWYITATSQASPGKPNSQQQYIPSSLQKEK